MRYLHRALHAACSPVYKPTQQEQSNVVSSSKQLIYFCEENEILVINVFNENDRRVCWNRRLAGVNESANNEGQLRQKEKGLRNVELWKNYGNKTKFLMKKS